MPIKIALIEDVSSVIRGSQDVAKSFDGVADSLDDMAREAQRAGKTTGDSIERGAKDGTDAVEKLEKSFKDMAQEANRQTKKAGDALGDDVKGGTHKASESVAEFKDEAKQNFSEVASSFSGGISGAADLVQGTLGGLASSLPGPIGLLSGLLAGIGGAWFASMQQNAEKQKALIDNLTADMIDSQQKVASESFIDQAIQAIATGADDAAISYDKLTKAAALTGIQSSTLARAYVGDTDAITTATDSIKSQLVDAWDKAHNGQVQYRSYYAEVASGLQGVLDDLDGVTEATDTAAQRQKLYNDAVQEGGAAAEGSAARAGDAYDSLGRKLDTLPKTLPIEVTVDTSALDRYRAALRRNPLTVGVVPGTQQPV